MRDKLIEILYNGFHISPKDELNGVVQKVADYLIAHGVTLATDNNVGDKWIPVSDRLPEDDYLDYLCQIKEADRGFCRIAICYFEEAFYENDFDCTEKVTHWMPLPAAPKEVE